MPDPLELLHSQASLPIITKRFRSQATLNTNLRSTLDQLFLEIPKLARVSTRRSEGKADITSELSASGKTRGYDGYLTHFTTLNMERNCRRLKMAVQSGRIDSDQYEARKNFRQLQALPVGGSEKTIDRNLTYGVIQVKHYSISSSMLCGILKYS